MTTYSGFYSPENALWSKFLNIIAPKIYSIQMKSAKVSVELHYGKFKGQYEMKNAIIFTFTTTIVLFQSAVIAYKNDPKILQ